MIQLIEQCISHVGIINVLCGGNKKIMSTHENFNVKVSEMCLLYPQNRIWRHLVFVLFVCCKHNSTLAITFEL